MALEINTSGFKHGLNDTFPNPKILKILRTVGGNISLSALMPTLLKLIQEVSELEKKSRLLVVSNRGPLKIRENGKIKDKPSFSRAVSGLVSAVEPVLNATGGIWIAWCGRKSSKDEDISLYLKVPQEKPCYTVKEVKLTAEEYQNYYLGFSNECLWPLCHNLIERCVFDREYWRCYREVNQKFATAAAEEWQEKDFIWIHDYHLALTPFMLREQLDSVVIAFFWHIPFPPFDVFRILPWAETIIEGLLGCDQVAFHSPAYARNFLECAERLAGVELAGKGRVRWKGREVKIKAIPLGVDAAYLENLAQDPIVQAQAQEIRQNAGTRYVALGVDRLDYTKGILERLQAVEKLLEKYPHYREEFTLLQIAVPSRTEVEEYRKLKRQVEETVGRINGRFGAKWQVPVHYQLTSFNLEQLVAHYLAADVMLVTPVRDGLNLVAKEYVASRVDEEGVLVLSPFCGSGEQLEEAVTANPYLLEDLAEKINYALQMPPGEAKKKMRQLRKHVKTFDLNYWWQNNLSDFLKVAGE